MKIKNVIIATFSVVLLASCGGTDACSCQETIKESGAAMVAAGMDAEKMAAATEEYASDLEACSKVSFTPEELAECAE